MGCGVSTDQGPSGGPQNQYAAPHNPKKDDPQEVAKSSGIDRDLDRAKQNEELKVKLLLLGAGESGKSTIFKQMRILHGAPRSEEDQRMYGVVIRSNVITAMRKLCSHLRSLGLEGQLAREPKPDDSDLTPKAAYDLLVAHIVDNTASSADLPIPPENADGRDWVGQSPRAGLGANNDAKQFLQLWRAMKTLWESKTMKEVWMKRAAVNVIDGHKEYLQDLSRIASPSFRPTTQDILLARVKTTQVVMERYRIDGIEFEMYDVGGQRSERRKWIDCFDNVDAVIFVAALSEYDQALAEAKRTNRMAEALELFRSVCNNRAFANTSIMLFLNKKDVFAEKIMSSDIAAQKPFADYAGPPQDFNSGVLYFIQKFKECLIDDDFNDSFIHVTCATDTNNMEFVLDSTRTIIMTDNLRRSGFLGSG
ncbi:guanine nucleotide-binding protein G(o) subunit alpha [Fistulifera solaris]|uniref:Guanine nucleotide-binding protein G(O) subunit alpha n=1 Tax=Fistulifera solaris TaxID=1519565 RepID=A0A1Z5JXU2_FISSO|nr:guanine nucleotide-binding protein G(o) subunit alpha [Fistulifera solaris]|eukprot:GAX18571.1 guanine nucleotide-binding protein G(o) subunit alpha [Fistulifera solaris]